MQCSTAENPCSAHRKASPAVPYHPLCLYPTVLRATANIISRITTSDLYAAKSACPKPGKIPLPGSAGTAGLCRPKYGPQIWAQTRVHAQTQKQCRSQSQVGPLVFRLLSGSKNKPRKGTHFWARTSQTLGPEKGFILGRLIDP